MPTYTYHCQKCGEQFDIKQRYDDKPKTKCKCGGKLEKVYNVPGIIYKANGYTKRVKG